MSNLPSTMKNVSHQSFNSCFGSFFLVAENKEMKFYSAVNNSTRMIIDERVLLMTWLILLKPLTLAVLKKQRQIVLKYSQRCEKILIPNGDNEENCQKRGFA
ncbi:CLUMA_CG011802, isoform A [Clunio marinus]|uniref:CLUMA_CG011802, isoform A n=1 Tax=Clunio marinus TaxID=568069 RepID=A0A1J1IDW8_9DIPT|nr:CLUMA_CG011802, isoform A [Clunio marinus]